MEGEVALSAKRRFTWLLPALQHAARWILGGVFVYAGLRKAFATQAFARDIQNYGFIASADLILLLAIYLPWLEIAAGAALILRRLQVGALVIIVGLMLVFTGALSSAWIRGLDIACGCFAEERSAPTRTRFAELLARDLALLLTAVLLLRLESRVAPVEVKAPSKDEF